ncbi:MAG: HD domain-containing phosphohydrolase [bacterium]
MVVGRPIYDVRFRLLLNAGAALTPEAIRRIRQEEYPSILIQEPGTEKINVGDLIGIRVRQEIAGALEAFSTWQQRDLDAQNLGEVLKGGKDGVQSAADVQKMIENAVDGLIRELMYQRKPVYYPGIYPSKNRLINHSTNVSILALLIGWRFRMNKQELLWLGKAALLHDVGKWRLARELISVHPEDYTEELHIAYSMHPQMSTVLLDQDVNMNMHIMMGVLQHHENQDGSGFPEQVIGSNMPPTSKLRPRGTIHRFAEIISISNYFDNLVSGRVTKMQLPPSAAVKKIIEATPSRFNDHITREALEVINVFPVGSLVRVGDSAHEAIVGYRGVVAKTNPEDLHRPKVTLLYGPRQRLEQPLTVDFATDAHARLEYVNSLN